MILCSQILKCLRDQLFLSTMWVFRFVRVALGLAVVPEFVSAAGRLGPPGRTKGTLLGTAALEAKMEQALE